MSWRFPIPMAAGQSVNVTESPLRTIPPESAQFPSAWYAVAGFCEGETVELPTGVAVPALYGATRGFPVSGGAEASKRSFSVPPVLTSKVGKEEQLEDEVQLLSAKIS